MPILARSGARRADRPLRRTGAPDVGRGPARVCGALAALALGGAALLSSGAVTVAQAQDAEAAAAGDAAAGREKSYTCLGCHGVEHYVNVYPSYHVPRIAGQHAEYLTVALQAYRAGTRQHQTMQANAGLLSDQDIADIAAYFASLGGTSP